MLPLSPCPPRGPGARPRRLARLLAAFSFAIAACVQFAGCGQVAGRGQRGSAEADAQADSAGGENKHREHVTLLLNWFPEAEHGGFYTAEVEKLFAAEGLEVTILPGGPESPVAQRVARGDVDFGVSNADNVLLARAQQAPVVAVMAPMQTSPRSIMVHRASGIRSFDDIKNITLAMSNSLAFSAYLRRKSRSRTCGSFPTPATW